MISFRSRKYLKLTEKFELFAVSIQFRNSSSIWYGFSEKGTDWGLVSWQVNFSTLLKSFYMNLFYAYWNLFLRILRHIFPAAIKGFHAVRSGPGGSCNIFFISKKTLKFSQIQVAQIISKNIFLKIIYPITISTREENIIAVNVMNILFIPI